MRSQLALWRRQRPNAEYPLTAGGAGQFNAPAAAGGTAGTTSAPVAPSQPPASGGGTQTGTQGGTAPGGIGTGTP